ncbi:tRNA (adenosine(37)-N6)-dimethylallyltransferase MiaA [Desulfotruncus alcoholivorax]|uniref:tRNA (adenosine(37)-N6)-dimethylallyltransferase MiaA n=1 Tax=Desulfotruncus alcoholivorax TaxID=265477 RepID=UPI00048494B2|nr:tRNA (adenosine(37)-N6)-dimethylallyltransferase MiaA [Desulfotruncus alcoholivorax]
MKQISKIPLLIITGPTASGKTSVAVKVAKKLDGEIISADSMLIYRYMNIGTAKPTPEEMEGVPHYLIDIVDPDDKFSVQIYQRLAREAIQNIYGRGKIPILAGGTGFYVDSVIYNYDFGFSGVDQEYRSFLQQIAEEKGKQTIHNMLKQVDPEAAERIHPNNLKRVIRALEIVRQAGRTGSIARSDYKNEYESYNMLLTGLYYDRNKLYQRIETRVDQMVARGLVEEVSNLLKAGYQKELASMQGLGYKEIIGYLLNEYSLEEAVMILKRNTRRFAKRQLTWFKRYSNINWIDMENYDTIDQTADDIVKLWDSTVGAEIKKKEK